MKIYVWAVVVFMLLAMAGVAGALASHRLHHDCRVRIDTAVDELGSPMASTSLARPWSVSAWAAWSRRVTRRRA